MKEFPPSTHQQTRTVEVLAPGALPRLAFCFSFSTHPGQEFAYSAEDVAKGRPPTWRFAPDGTLHERDANGDIGPIVEYRGAEK